MNIRFLHSKIGKNYGWELNSFYKYRDFTDGIDFFIFNVEWDRYAADHKPSFEMALKFMNIMVFEFIIYNIWHTDNPNSSYHEEYLEEQKELYQREPPNHKRTAQELYEADGPNYERYNHD